MRAFYGMIVAPKKDGAGRFVWGSNKQEGVRENHPHEPLEPNAPAELNLPNLPNLPNPTN